MNNDFTFETMDNKELYSVNEFYDDFVRSAQEKGIDLSKPDAYEMLFSSGDIQAKSFFRAFGLPLFSELKSIDTLCMMKKLDGWENENQSLNKRNPEKCEAISCTVNNLKGIVRYEDALAKIYLYMEDFLWKSMDSVILDKCRDGKLEISTMDDLKSIAEKTGLLSVSDFEEKLRKRITDVYDQLQAVNENLPDELEIVDAGYGEKRKKHLSKKFFVRFGVLAVALVCSPFLVKGVVLLKKYSEELSHEKAVKVLLKECHEDNFVYLVSQLRQSVNEKDNFFLEIDEDIEELSFSASYIKSVEPILILLSHFHSKYHSPDIIPRQSDKWEMWMWFNKHNEYPDEYNYSKNRLTQCPFCIAIDYKLHHNDAKNLKTNIEDTFIFKYSVTPVLMEDLNEILKPENEKILRSLVNESEENDEDANFMSRFISTEYNYRKHVYLNSLLPEIKNYLERSK